MIVGAGAAPATVGASVRGEVSGRRRPTVAAVDLPSSAKVFVEPEPTHAVPSLYDGSNAPRAPPFHDIRGALESIGRALPLESERPLFKRNVGGCRRHVHERAFVGSPVRPWYRSLPHDLVSACEDRAVGLRRRVIFEDIRAAVFQRRVPEFDFIGRSCLGKNALVAVSPDTVGVAPTATFPVHRHSRIPSLPGTFEIAAPAVMEPLWHVLHQLGLSVGMVLSVLRGSAAGDGQRNDNRQKDASMLGGHDFSPAQRRFN